MELVTCMLVTHVSQFVFLVYLLWILLYKHLFLIYTTPGVMPQSRGFVLSEVLSLQMFYQFRSSLSPEIASLEVISPQVLSRQRFCPFRPQVLTLQKFCPSRGSVPLEVRSLWKCCPSRSSVLQKFCFSRSSEPPKVCSLHYFLFIKKPFTCYLLFGKWDNICMDWQ